MTDQFILRSEHKSGCSKGTTILSMTHISYQPQVLLGPVFYLITLGSRWGYNGPIGNEVGVHPMALMTAAAARTPDDRSDSKCLVAG